MTSKLRTALGAVLMGLSIVLSGCGRAPERDLGTLVLEDSTYLSPETLQPYSGDVVRFFPDEPGKVQLRGVLENGTWNGELVVYHPNGRIRYMGTLSNGVKCGAWTENQDPDPPGSVYQELKQEIESMGLYPPCS